MFNIRFSTLTGFVFLAALMRLVPHPWNFTPIAAMALFSGAHFPKTSQAMAVPLAALFLSDLILGFHSTWIFVYAAFAVSVLMGRTLKNATSQKIIIGSLGSSVFFFLMTNAGVWLVGKIYPMTLSGLMSCYIAGVPFFRNEVLSTLFYSSMLFSSYRLLCKAFPKLQPVTI